MTIINQHVVEVKHISSDKHMLCLTTLALSKGDYVVYDHSDSTHLKAWSVGTITQDNVVGKQADKWIVNWINPEKHFERARLFKEGGRLHAKLVAIKNSLSEEALFELLATVNLDAADALYAYKKLQAEINKKYSAPTFYTCNQYDDTPINKALY